MQTKKIVMIVVLLFTLVNIKAQTIPDYSTVKEIPLQADGYKVLAEVYVSEKQIKTDNDKFYSWVKANIVHSTQGGYEGRLLHGTYSEFYPDNQIKQKGKFDNGLRTGEWKSWYPDGKLKEITHWKKGRMDGKIIRYNDMGKIDLNGNFSNGKQDGKWITYDSSGTEIKVNYKNGVEKEKKQNRLFKKKDKKVIPLEEENPSTGSGTKDSTDSTKTDTKKSKKIKTKKEKTPKQVQSDKKEEKKESSDTEKSKKNKKKEKSEVIKEPFDKLRNQKKN